MNKKQLIVAWVINSLLFSILIFFLSGCCHPKGTGQFTDGKSYIEGKFSIPF